jgi:hypothetical protein
MRTLLRLAFLPALLLLPQRPAHAADIGGAYRIGLGLPLNVSSTVILCPSSDGSFSAVSCNFSGGGGGGGAVTQATTPWITADQNIANSYAAGIATAPIGELQMGGQYEAAPLNMTNGTSGPLQITQAGALEVAELDIPAVNSLNLTSTANVLTLPIANGESTMAMEFVGLTAGAATIAMYGSVDGINFAQIGFQTNILGYGTSLNVDVPLVRVNVSGLKAIQIKVIVAGTGSATITSNVTAATNPAVILAGNTASGVPYMNPTNSNGVTTVNANATGHTGAAVNIAVADYNTLLEAFTEQTVAGGGTPAMDQYGAAYSDTEGVKPTYQSWALITPIAGITYSFCGSATKQVRVRDISINGDATTAGGMTFALMKTTTAPTGGTSASAGDVANQSTDTPTAVAPLIYSAVPTTGTVAGNIEAAILGFPLISAANPATSLRYGAIDDTKSIVLTGIAQCIELNMAGTVPTGAQMAVGINWTEQ